MADFDVFLHLRLLNVGSQFVLVGHDFCLQQSHLLHQVFVQLIFVDFAALFGEQLHFFFDELEDENLFVFVEHAVTTHIKDLKELVGGAQSEQIVNVVTLRVKD